MTESKEAHRLRNRKRRESPEYRATEARAQRESRKSWSPERRERQRRYAHKHRIAALGVTPEQYDQMLADQGGVCAICGEPETSKQGGTLRVLAVDHCHETGRVRGLLCLLCNPGIGKLHDNPGLLRVAADYLEELT